MVATVNPGMVSNLSNPNLLINGDFSVWQRGTSITGAVFDDYTADRWRVAGNGAGGTRNFRYEGDGRFYYVCEGNSTLDSYLVCNI